MDVHKSQISLPTLVGGACALLVVLWINNAIPGYTAPTMGQAVWLSGFAESFIRQPGLSIWADMLGHPSPAPVVFGLPGAILIALLRSLGLSVVTAYTGAVAILLTLAFLGAYRCAYRVGSTRAVAMLAALFWCCQPLVWNHAGYSMLSIGIALLPAYLLTVFYAISRASENTTWKSCIWRILLSTPTAMMAIFTDGYTFVMYALAAALSLGAFALRHPQRLRAVSDAALVIGSSLLIAYFSYSAYVGVSQFAGEGLSWYRAWALDFSFLLIPTQGVHWLPDLLGLSTPRSQAYEFGDASVWTTTFAAPILICAVFAAVSSSSGTSPKWLGAVLISLAGFYFAAGPDLKFFSQKPQVQPPIGSLMGAKYARFSTGSGILFSHVPGLRNTRATYRWAALGGLGLWILVILGSRREEPYRAVVICGLAAACMLNLPHPKAQFIRGINNVSMFDTWLMELPTDLSNTRQSQQPALFIPAYNDIALNLLAPLTNITTFNVGGDKNVLLAREKWPVAFPPFKPSMSITEIANQTKLALNSGEVGEVIIPHFDLLWGAHVWPSDRIFSKEQVESLGELLIADPDELPVSVKTGQFFTSIVLQGCKAFNLGEKNSPFKTQESWIEGVGVTSLARGGFLLFGPYIDLPPGSYFVEIMGDGDVKADDTIEITKLSGQVIKSSKLVNVWANHKAAKQIFQLHEPTKEIEFRVIVGEGSSLNLSTLNLCINAGS